MTDIAELGLAVDSRDIVQARDELSRFSAQAKRAEIAASTFARSAGQDFDATGKKGETAAKRLRDAVTAFDKQANARANGAGNSSRAADIEAYGKHLDDLRAKYNPLFAAERKHKEAISGINVALLGGALAQAEATLAIKNAEQEHRDAVAAIEKHNTELGKTAGASKATKAAMMNLSFQIQDIATQAAMGADAFRIFASQGSQVYQALQQGEGGVRGSFGYIGNTIRGLLTPMNLLVGATIGLGAAAYNVAATWRDAQHEINLALIGTGGAAGTTANDINRISLAAADAGEATVGEARRMALAFASTGKISGELNEKLVDISRGFGALYGETSEEGAARLARIFADPAKGIEELNKRLSAFDAATVQNVRNLAAQGNRMEASRILIDGIRSATQQAAAETGGWSNAWRRLTAATSEYWALAGRAIDVATGGAGGTGLDRQLALAERRLKDAQAGSVLRGGGVVVDAGKVREATNEVERLQRAIRDANQAAAEAPGNARSNEYSDAIRAAIPDLQAVKEAKEALATLQRANQDAAGLSGLPNDEQQMLSRATRLRQEEVASLNQKNAAQKTSIELAQQEHSFAMQAIAARTVEERAELAYRQTLAREKQAGNINYEFAARAAQREVLAQETRAITDEIRQRNFAAQQSVDLAALELSLVGKTADEAERLRAAYQAKQQVEADAFNRNRTASPQETQDAMRLANDKADLDNRKRRDELLRDLDFERSQYGRSETEQAVYSRMQAAGMLQNGQIVGAQNEQVAAQIRLNEQLQRSIDIQREFASTFLHDMMAGKSAMEALGSALDNLASRMLDNSINLLFSGITGLGGTPTGGMLRGNILPGIFHAGGIVGNDNVPSRSVPASVFATAKRYHNGGVIGADEVPAILQKGEKVLSRKQVAAGAGGGGGIVINMPVSLDARGAYPESIADINARLNEMPKHIFKAVADARERRKG